MSQPYENPRREMVPANEIQVTMIAGQLHEWLFFPGKWDRYTPQPGDLLRVWTPPPEKPAARKSSGV